MIIYYERADSTNRLAKELALQGRVAGTVVQAGVQSSGKGQYGRSFSSPAGGLYFSLLLRPDLPAEDLPLITLAAGLACHDALEAAFSLQSRIKWPNDLYLAGKKLAGILCENIFVDGQALVIAGVGLNANSNIRDFPEELQPIVTTLQEHLRYSVDIETLLVLLVQTIMQYVDLLKTEKGKLLERWRSYDYLKGKKLQYTADALSFFGTGEGISPEGRYCLRDEQGNRHTIIAGQLRLASALEQGHVTVR